MKRVFEAWRIRQPGEIRRRDFRWEYDLGLRETSWGPPWKGFAVLHRDESGAVDGYARYHVEEKWDQRQPRNIVDVDDFHALTDDAYAAIWRFLADLDWAATIKAERRSPAERLPWLLTNARAAEISNVGDGQWVRLFDVPRALEARTYERDCRLVLEVIDAEAEGGRTRLLLDVGPAGASCSASDRPADLTLDVSSPERRVSRRCVASRGHSDNRSGRAPPRCTGDADALLRTLDEPWASTFF